MTNSSERSPRGSTAPLRWLAWLHVVQGGLGLGAVLFLLLLVATSSDHDSQAGYYVLPLALMVGGAVFAPSLVGGLGLLRGRPWAVPVLSGVAALELLIVPAGTVIGIVTLVALVRAPRAPHEPREPHEQRLGDRDDASDGPHAADESRADAGRRVAGFAAWLLPTGARGFATQRRGRRTAAEWRALAVVFLGVASGFVVVIGLGFRLSGDIAPAELDVLFWPAAVVLSTALALGGSALVDRLRRAPASVQQPAASPFERPADPPAVPWPTDAAALCMHLQPIERTLRERGVPMRRDGARAVLAKVRVDSHAVATELAASGLCYQEIPAYDRSLRDPPVARLHCAPCDASIVVWHTDLAPPGTPVFPFAS